MNVGRASLYFHSRQVKRRRLRGVSFISMVLNFLGRLAMFYFQRLQLGKEFRFREQGFLLFSISSRVYRLFWFYFHLLVKVFQVLHRRANSRGRLLSMVIGNSRLIGGRRVRIPRVLCYLINGLRLQLTMLGVVMKGVSCRASNGNQRVFRRQTFMFFRSLPGDVSQVLRLLCNFFFDSILVSPTSLGLSIYANSLRK